MRDVSAALLPAAPEIRAPERRQLVGALVALHTAEPGAGTPEACPLDTRYRMFSPATAAAERRNGNPHGAIIGGGWEVFADVAAPDVSEAVLALAADPDRLVRGFGGFRRAVVHGDVRLGNLGIAPGSVTLIDWGERIGLAPAALDLGWLMGFDGYRLGADPDEVLGEIRGAYGAVLDPGSLELALGGALVQVGGIVGHWIGAASDPGERRRYEDHLRWLSDYTRAAVDA
jgi:hypothetical protein